MVGEERRMKNKSVEKLVVILLWLMLDTRCGAESSSMSWQQLRDEKERWE